VDDAWWTLTETTANRLLAARRRWMHWRRRRGDALSAASDPLRQSWRHAGLRRRALVVVLAILPFAMLAACAVVVASIR
jgi:hypothetical protein